MDSDPKNHDFFQVAVKGLFFKDDKLMMIQEDNGTWELPGGRIQKGEDLIEALKREVQEETGLECQMLEDRPYLTYSTLDRLGNGRLMIFYKVNFDNLDFTPSGECMKIEFYNKDQIRELKTTVQLEKLPDYL